MLVRGFLSGALGALTLLCIQSVAWAVIPTLLIISGTVGICVYADKVLK